MPQCCCAGHRSYHPCSAVAVTAQLLPQWSMNGNDEGREDYTDDKESVTTVLQGIKAMIHALALKLPGLHSW